MKTATLSEICDLYPTTSTRRSLEAAVSDGWTISHYSTPLEDAATDVSIDVAIEICADDPGLIYLTNLNLTQTALQADLAARYQAYRATQTALQADLAARYQAYRATVIDALGAEAVALLDHPDLVKVGDLADITESDARDEIVAAHTTFSWIVRLEVCGTWVADGFELTDDRALDMLAHDLTMANIGEQLGARVIAGPPADAIARTQGYRDAADREARERKEQHDDEVADALSF